MSFRAQVQIDTVKSLAGAIAAGGALATLANSALDLSDGEIDQKEAPAAYEVAYITTASPAPTVTTQREYVWGPGDRGIYELVMQFDASASRVWVMQDEGGDVCGAADGSGFSGAARLLGAWSYGPYGEVIKDASVAGVTLSPIHAGHKGLFVDRLDVGVQSPLGFENPRLAMGATHAVYANNRTLLPKIGRWGQADPNASGLVTLGQVALGGSGLPIGINGLDLRVSYFDGASLYQYAKSGPWNQADPLGLSIMGFFPWMTLEGDLQALDGGVKIGAINAFRIRMMGLMAKYYAHMIIGAEAVYGAATGLPEGQFGQAVAEANMMLMRTVENMAGKEVGQLMSLTGRNFRANLQELTGFAGRFLDEIIEAHHIIPQEFRRRFAQLGINIDNPLFGQWIDEATHAVVHAGGAYNLKWLEFLERLEQKGMRGDDAYREVFTFIKDIAAEYKFVTPF